VNDGAPNLDFEFVDADLSLVSLAELSRLLAARKTSSREIVDVFLTRIAALDGRLHAFIEVYADEARALAKAADLERDAGIVRSPLHGLPIALKDLLHFAPHQTTAGSKSWLGRKSDTTATVVVRLIAAGMIPLGKTHMVEFAFGGWGRNEPMGAPWNPWDLSIHHVAGGSSSGSAVAVAAGLAPAAIGSDTGGSIRIPAALCGLTGLKPTYGLVSLAGVVPLATTLDSIGPLARTVEDAALVTAAIAGPDPLDRATLAAGLVDFRAAIERSVDIKGTRVTALAFDLLPKNVDIDVLEAYATTIQLLRDLGAHVDEQSFDFDLEDVMLRNGRIIAAEAYAVHRAYIEDAGLQIDPWVRKRTVAGKSVSAAEYLDELAYRRHAMARFARWMVGRDVLLTPTLPITAVPVVDVDESTTTLATFTRAANYLGACALSLPAGLSRGGLPIGVQLTGAAFTDELLVHVGRAIQRETSWHLRTPQLPAPDEPPIL
jgi:aspartyl-tRNA(Asn)/glutamyl-tRNA(Gln) amidotransferase subunit A